MLLGYTKGSPTVPAPEAADGVIDTEFAPTVIVEVAAAEVGKAVWPSDKRSAKIAQIAKSRLSDLFESMRTHYVFGRTHSQMLSDNHTKPSTQWSF